MKIRMKNLVITNYCETDKRKLCFIKEISEDPLVRHFVSNNMDEWLEDSIDTEKLLVGLAYIVASDIKLVGFIRCAFLDTNGILNLHYGVHPDYREMHYGTKILEETSEYLFRSDMPIKNIELYIKEINKGSIKCAINAGFTLDRSFPSRIDNCKVNVYSKKK